MSSLRSQIGGIFMVAGCSMGAGCLALPMLAAGPNFIFSSIFIILSGLLSYYIAYISLEIFMYYKNGANGSTIAVLNFGNVGKVIFALLNGILMYTILSVYMSGGADVLGKTILPAVHLDLSPLFCLLIFLVVTVPIFFKGVDLVVKSNTIVFSIKFLCFIIALVVGIKFISPTIFVVIKQELRYLPVALPVFLTSLWFHFLIPVLARMYNYNRKTCRSVFAYGIIIPVVLYILWTAIILSLVPRNGEINSFYSILSNKQSVGVMIKYAIENNPHIPAIMRYAIDIFSNIVMITSFLTVGISTYDYVRDMFKIKQNRLGVLLNVALTMLPSILCAIYFPDGFVFIFQQAAIILMLINIFTILCCLKQYNNLEYKPNKASIYLILCILSILIILQTMDNLGYLPSFGIN